MIGSISTKVGRITKIELQDYELIELPPSNLDHCFDFLRQAIMCHGDVSMTYWFVVLDITLDSVLP